MKDEKLVFDPRNMAMVSDPHAFYRKLRAVDPVHWSERSNCWVLTRFDDVNSVLKDDRFGRGTTYRITAASDEQMNDVEKLRSHLMPFKDGDEHTRIRTAMNAVFHKRVSQLQPRLEALANELLDAVEGKQTFDLIGDYAYPLSVGAISMLLGIPLEDKDIFKRFSPHFSALLVPRKTEADVAMAKKMIDELSGYFQALLDENRHGEKDNVISMMLHENGRHGKMSEEEMMVMPIFLIFAGHETTMNMIGNGMYELFQQPEQLAKMIAHPEYMPSAIEEILRMTSTNAALYRVAFEDVTIGGKLIKKGDEVVAVLSAANRDPERYTDPDTIDITRDEGANIAFGNGIHHCLGSNMARLEGNVAFETLFKRFPGIALAEEPEWKESFVFRGLKALYVSPGE